MLLVLVVAGPGPGTDLSVLMDNFGSGRGWTFGNNTNYWTDYGPQEMWLMLGNFSREIIRQPKCNDYKDYPAYNTNTMIFRFSCTIIEPSHKSIFQANLVKLFLWKFLTFSDNISICQAVSSQPTNCLAGNFLFLVLAEAHWLMHETRNHQRSCGWPDQLSVTKTKDRISGNSSTAFI